MIDMSQRVRVFSPIACKPAVKGAAVTLLGLALSACDRCGDLWPFPGPPTQAPHACRDDAPRQPQRSPLP